ncbi:MAG: DUF309 domain-containing protein [Verrucomicrobiota bacterium]
MSKKSPKIAELLKDIQHPVWEANYLGYFKCFNQQMYYEAHDVLEELWLIQGKSGKNYAFYKGLIQFAGAFVHMKLHKEFPEHHVHGRRLEPASRLIKLALGNVSSYGDVYQDLDLKHLSNLGESYYKALIAEDFKKNPWSPDIAPKLEMPR